MAFLESNAFAGQYQAGAGEDEHTRPLVAVIGAGFSGLLTAIHILRRPDGPRVRLIEGSPVFARGAAYSTANPNHLLNVRVANMSAFPDAPGDFKEWLSRSGGWSAQGEFVTRGGYGAYLQDILRATTRTVPAGRLLLDTDEIVAARPQGDRWNLVTGMGRSLTVDAVVVAVGLGPPARPPGAQDDLLRSQRYVANPWDQDADLEGLGRRVLLLGTGLTMVDVALDLSGSGRTLVALSRRGIAPRAHAPVSGLPAAPPSRVSPRGLTRWVRRTSEEGHWRGAIDALRPHVQDVWTGWSPRDRGQFLRHLRPWWDAHRHRVAPAVAHRMQALQATGELTIQAGRVSKLDLRPHGVAVSWTGRGTRSTRRRVVDAVVNCTGPEGSLTGGHNPLLAGMQAMGLLRTDTFTLGADVDRQSRPLNAYGVATPGLYLVGPLARGTFWEITSVPHIRLQAQQVAGAACDHLARTHRARGGAA